MNARDRYRDYSADNSIPIPRNTVWRQSKHFQSTDEDINSYDQTEVSVLKNFHENSLKLMNQYSYEAKTRESEEFEPYEDSDEDIDDDLTKSKANATDESDDANKPIYPGAQLTIAASMVLLISFAMRHSLTGDALADLLVLVELHCLTPNFCHRNVKTFMEFFRHIKSPLQLYYYCDNCHMYFGREKPLACINCQSRKKSIYYFLVIPIVTQLSKLFADGKLIKQIQNQKEKIMQRRSQPFITDITDGLLYKETFLKNGLFKGSTDKNIGELHISLEINTDGVSLFHSSTFSVWPIYFVVNELPHSLRFTRSNRIFAGLWFGYTKPDFGVFLKPIAESLHDLFFKGFVVNDTKVKAIVLNGIFDAPARCLFQNMVQFNGFFGCPYCLAPGETVKTSERGHTHSYPFNTKSVDGCHQKRTHASHKRQAEDIEQAKLNGTLNNNLGVKGVSWFLYVPKFDIIRGVGIDYMHCVLLGIVKMLLGLWFDKSHRNEIFSISSLIDKVNERLLGIKPPNFIARIPRSLTEVSHFKAAELKNFLLFYSLPCLLGYLPKDQYNHFSLLVFSIYVLLQESITKQDLILCKRKLLEFVLNIPALYGERYQTSNMHLLLHLTEKVEELGPLWCNSCFYFEDFNGQLRRLFHGTQSIDMQIAFAVGVHQSLPTLSRCLHYGSPEHEFYNKMMEKNVPKPKDKISDNCFVLGAYFFQPLTEVEQHAIFLKIGKFDSFVCFKRLYCKNHVIQSMLYRTSVRRDNTVVKVKENNFGTVRVFVKVQANSNAVYIALVNMMKKIDDNLNNFESTVNSHLVKLDCSQTHLQAVFVEDLSDVGIMVKIQSDVCFVSIAPNKIEKE